MPHEQAVEIIRKDRGTHFDPDIIDAFIDIHEQFRSIATMYTDSGSDLEKKKAFFSAAIG